jgi:hypothetical protein
VDDKIITQPESLAEPEIESAQPLDAAVILAREPQIAEIRRHRLSHPTASEDARARWEAEQKKFACNYVDVDGVGVCLTHGSAPMKEKHARDEDDESVRPVRRADRRRRR